MTCVNCHQPIRSCPVGDYCWCNGYVHDGDSHPCPAAHQPTDGWPLANLADPDWDALFGRAAGAR